MSFDRPWRVWAGSMALALGCVAAAAPALSQSPSDERGALFPPFPSPVFDAPIAISSTFGDLRNNHLHAGLDLATGSVVGWPVHAPMDGGVVRLRASGVGYGRSIYVETPDGRLIVFGHLDAFAEPFASFIAHLQDSTGQYEQDVWPDAGRFHVRAGEVIAWSGRSGTGGPHLHIEVRRGDMAIHPLRAGLVSPDSTTPRIVRVTLVPLDDSSAVNGARTPAAVAVAHDSARAMGWGRLRVVVEALDSETDGTWDVAPWRVRASTSASDWVECRFDSVSWATDMSQADFVYDRGRYTAGGRSSVVLAVPEGHLPRMMRTAGSGGSEAGVVRLDAAHPLVTLAIEAEDLAGHIARRTILLRAGGRLAAATRAPAGTLAATMASGATARIEGVGRWAVPPGALFEPSRLEFRRGAKAKVTGELIPVGTPVFAGPASTPLRLPVEVALDVPPAVPLERIGLYRAGGEGWEQQGDRADLATREIVASTRRLGRFALFRDVRAPRIAWVAPPRHAVATPYPRWDLEAGLSEAGSGVDAAASYFIVDGRRVPSEWDDVKSTLRWWPLRAPSAGIHHVQIVAADRAGNTRRTARVFVLE